MQQSSDTKSILLALIVIILSLFFVTVNNLTINAHAPAPSQTSDFAFPIELLLEDEGLVQLRGHALEQFIKRNNVHVPENETLVSVTFVPFPPSEHVPSQIGDPRLPSGLEMRNTRIRSGTFVYPASRREDIFNNHGNTSSSFTRSLSGTASSGVTANAGLTIRQLELGLGFTLNFSSTETQSVTVTVPPRTQARLEWVVRSEVWDFDVHLLPVGSLIGSVSAHRPFGLIINEFQSSL